MLKRITASIILVCISAAAFAASGGGHEDYLLSGMMSKEMQDFLFKCINFAILLFILHKFARKPIANMLSAAAKNTKDTMESAEVKLKKAEAKLADYQKKFVNLEKEMASMQERSMAAIEEEKKKMVKDAEEAAKKIEQQTQVRIEQDVLKAKMEVRHFLVEESIKLAEQLIAEKIDSKEQKALISNYVNIIKEIA